MALPSPPAWPGVTHRMVDVGPTRLHVAEAGSGPPLLLVAGWPQHWWAVRHLIAPLARRHRVLATDLRGLGWSDAPAGDYRKDELAADLLGLLDAEGIETATVVGHDWGGYCGWLLALEHPERVERLVVLECPPPWRPPLHPRQLGLPLFASYQFLVGAPKLGPAVQRGVGQFIPGIIRAGSGSSATWADEDLERYAERFRHPDRAEATSAYYRTFLTRELFPTQRGRFSPRDLTVPTLLVFGRESWLYKVLGRGVKPTAALQVEVIDGAGHFLPEEAPDRVLGLVEPFLD